MTTHRYHPILEDEIRKGIDLNLIPEGFPGDPPFAILYDECDRCAEHATNPALSLDTQNIEALMLMVITDTPGRTGNERTAMERLTPRTSNIW